MSELIFQASPVVTLATNTFINVPVILKFEDENLIEVIDEEAIGHTTQIPIYHSDGTYLAKVKGTRMFLTEDGKKAGLKIEKFEDVWECTQEGRTLFEIHLQGGDSFKINAELYAPEGYFVKCNDSPDSGLVDIKGNELKIGNTNFAGNMIVNVEVGFWVRRNGSWSIG